LAEKVCILYSPSYRDSLITNVITLCICCFSPYEKVDYIYHRATSSSTTTSTKGIRTLKTPKTAKPTSKTKAEAKTTVKTETKTKSANGRPVFYSGDNAFSFGGGGRGETSHSYSLGGSVDHF
jgi:hypothetical protein